MPNRLIKESIYGSEKVNRLTDFQFRVWVSLITYVDDYGRGDARPVIIKGRCFPLRNQIKPADIDRALQQLAAVGCIQLYTVDGAQYLCFPNWSKHQRIRTKLSKYPSPDGLRQSAAICGNSPQHAAGCGQNPIQSNPESNPIHTPLPPSRGAAVAEVADCTANNPYADSSPPRADTPEAYAANNLQAMSPRNMEELASFRDTLPDELIIWAIDEATAHGAPRYSYVRSVLNRCIERNIKTVGDAKVAEEARRRRQNSDKDGPEVKWLD